MENNWKFLHPCDVITCNAMNYLLRRQSERYIIMKIILPCVSNVFPYEQTLSKVHDTYRKKVSKKVAHCLLLDLNRYSPFGSCIFMNVVDLTV